LLRTFKERKEYVVQHLLVDVHSFVHLTPGSPRQTQMN
jgi:hypothetical protein